MTYYDHYSYKDWSYCKGTFGNGCILTDCAEAELNYLDGSRLEGRRGGKINAEGQYSGPCIYYYADHTDDSPHYLQGLFKDGKLDGLGKLIDKSHSYDCQWKNGKVDEDEQGTMEAKEDGVLTGKYEGTFQHKLDGSILPHGQGRYDYHNVGDAGAMYTGEYKEGLQHGAGLFKHSENNVIFEYYEGDFKRGVAQGHGTLKFKDTFEKGLILTGEFTDNNSDGFLAASTSGDGATSETVCYYTYEWPPNDQIRIKKYDLQRRLLKTEVLHVYRSSENSASHESHPGGRSNIGSTDLDAKNMESTQSEKHQSSDNSLQISTLSGDAHAMDSLLERQDNLRQASQPDTTRQQQAPHPLTSGSMPEDQQTEGIVLHSGTVPIMSPSLLPGAGTTLSPQSLQPIDGSLANSIGTAHQPQQTEIPGPVLGRLKRTFSQTEDEAQLSLDPLISAIANNTQHEKRSDGCADAYLQPKSKRQKVVEGDNIHPEQPSTGALHGAFFNVHNPVKNHLQQEPSSTPSTKHRHQQIADPNSSATLPPSWQLNNEQYSLSSEVSVDGQLTNGQTIFTPSPGTEGHAYTQTDIDFIQSPPSPQEGLCSDAESQRLDSHARTSPASGSFFFSSIWQSQAETSDNEADDTSDHLENFLLS